MPPIDWNQVYAEIGAAEWGRLRPWFLAHNAVWQVWHRARWVFWLAWGYSLIALVSDLGRGDYARAGNEAWPVLQVVACVVMLAGVVFLRLSHWLLLRKVARLRARAALSRLAAAPVAAGPAPVVSEGERDLSPAEPAAPTEQDLEARLGERISMLDDQWRWMQDRLGKEEWGRLVSLRKAWSRLPLIYSGAFAVSAVYVALVFTEVVSGRTSWAVALRWHPMQLAPLVAVLCALGQWVLSQVISQRLARLQWSGYSAPAIAKALWSEYIADELGQTVARREKLRATRHARARLEEELRATPHWKTELSGAHLIWWISFVLKPFDRIIHGPELWVIVYCLFYPALLPKLAYWVFYISASAPTRLLCLRVYRWWGRGWLPVALLLLPVALGLAIFEFRW